MKPAPWKPTCAAELGAFEANFCARCANDAGCPIRADGQVYDIGHPAFPREWTIETEGPECAAFVERDPDPWDEYWEE